MASAKSRSRRQTVETLAMRLDGHEDLCGERYRNLDQKIDNADRKIDERHMANNQRMDAWMMEQRQSRQEIIQKLEEGSRRFDTLAQAIGKTDEEIAAIPGQNASIWNAVYKAAIGALVAALAVVLWFVISGGKA